MSKNYDNWEKLVSAVMLKEKDRVLAMSTSLSSKSSSSYESFVSGRSLQLPSFALNSISYGDGFSWQHEQPKHKKLYVDQRSGKRCYMVEARGLKMSSGSSHSWKWTTLTDSSDRTLEVAELQYLWWLDIRGKIPSQILSQMTTYEAHLVFKLSKKTKGLESTKAMVRFINDEPEQDAEKRARIVHLDPAAQNKSVSTMINRDDGWMEVEIGKFYVSREENGEVEARLLEKNWTIVKAGLVVGGIEFRPTFKYSDEPIFSKQCQSRLTMA